MTGDAVLAVEDVALEVGGRELVSCADFTLGASECVGLVGESGSGKSLTCRAVLGLLSRIGARVTRGRIVVAGRDMTAATEQQWRTVRGAVATLVPQASLAALDPLMRIGPQMKEVIRRHDGDADWRRRATELLENVEMPDPVRVLRSYPHELSGGMRQRVVIAQAIASRPALLVADEATTALDASVQRSIVALFDRLRKETAMAILLVSHDLSVVRSIADSIAVMYAGVVVERGRAGRVLNRPCHPYTRGLLAADLGLIDRGQPLRGLAGAPPGPEDWSTGCRFGPRCTHVRDRCEVTLPELESAAHGGVVACGRWKELQP